MLEERKRERERACIFVCVRKREEIIYMMIEIRETEMVREDIEIRVVRGNGCEASEVWPGIGVFRASNPSNNYMSCLQRSLTRVTLRDDMYILKCQNVSH